MKKRLALSLVAILTCASVATADIQSPPGHAFNWSRKLSRGIANLAYGPLEILSYWSRSNHTDGSLAASVVGPIEGTKRALVRVGYGVFEVLTFPAPAYKGTFRPATYRKQRIDPWFGYDEFAPQLGVSGQAGYSRTQNW
jgi:putative exosortase-associated protein (TIGR04073 family)